MNIDKNFINETNNLIANKEILENEINKKFLIIKERLEEMREKYRFALEELKKEYVGGNFYGYSPDGWREIISIKCREKDYDLISIKNIGDYFEIEALDCFRDHAGEKEMTKIPYEKKNDDIFVKEYKEIRKQEFIKEQKEKVEKERIKYFELKNKFEK